MNKRRRELDEEEKIMPHRLLEACGYKTPHTANRKKMTVATPTLQSYCKKMLS